MIALTRPDLCDDAIAAIVNRIQAAVAEPMPVAGRELRITCSIGVSRFPDDGVEAGDLLKNADAAMYRAKRTAATTSRAARSDTLHDPRSCDAVVQELFFGIDERGEIVERERHNGDGTKS